MRYLTIFITMLSLLVGCGGNMTAVIKHEPYKVEGNLLARVNVKDVRTLEMATSKREAAFGVSMGDITFDPSETQIVKNVLEVELTKLMKEKGIQTNKYFSCDIINFDIKTPAKTLYWDVVGRIDLILKHDGKEYSLSGTHTERTYVYPSETIINKTLDESLKQIVAQLKKASSLE
jgi:hypothetical protein